MGTGENTIRALSAVLLAVALGCGTEDSSTHAPAAPATATAAAGTSTAYPDPRGQCNIDSGFADDHACLLPPAPNEGVQLHVGPTDYNDPAQIEKFVMHPGGESSECWTFHTPNDQPFHYQSFVLSGRTGTHHIINTMYSGEAVDGGFTFCRDGGIGFDPEIIDTMVAARPFLPREAIAPENEQIAHLVPAHAAIQADMHYFNPGDKDVLREFWLNLYFAPEAKIKVEPKLLRAMGGFGWNIQPGTDRVYNYACPVQGTGRILDLAGHYHSHGQRFTAWLQHTGQDPMKVFEMYDYREPAVFQYDTITHNLGFTDGKPGALSGMLDVRDGDILSWECHIVNDSDSVLTYVNSVDKGEMCNLWGETLDTSINCLVPDPEFMGDAAEEVPAGSD